MKKGLLKNRLGHRKHVLLGFERMRRLLANFKSVMLNTLPCSPMDCEAPVVPKRKPKPHLGALRLQDQRPWPFRVQFTCN